MMPERRRVLVAIDHSESSHRVVQFVQTFFDELSVDIIAVSVAAVPTPWVPPGVGWGGVYTWGSSFGSQLVEDSIDHGTTAAMAAAEESIVASGLTNAEHVVEFGDASDRILKAAEEHDVDMIIVGAPGHGLLERLMSRSVSTEVARHAHVPVLLIP